MEIKTQYASFNSDFSNVFSGIDDQNSLLNQIKIAASEVGVIALFANSDDKIQSQLNRLTKLDNIPIMLISWDINTDLFIDENGFLQNPSSNVSALLVDKPSDLTSEQAMKVAEKMGKLFEVFIVKLYRQLSVFQKSGEPAINNISYQFVPQHGAGKHSGVLAKWTQRNYILMECE